VIRLICKTRKRAVAGVIALFLIMVVDLLKEWDCSWFHALGLFLYLTAMFILHSDSYRS
jgi:hypothetical protein